ncbi:hypothetical protein RBE51_20080 [Pseudomonas taiwanensis]|uniref:hypothetical protein n=1 Tax=Pseudomonas taiwanensis TaxID=470150 RepID=UPI0028DDDE47|nr:hypothetical protein [Pseudomonas taiwanensis]MDT8925092.1 hypothetical protein [Pseudomonas taiwanensis]
MILEKIDAALALLIIYGVTLMSFLKSAVGSAFKILIAFAIVLILSIIGARLALSYMIHETKQRWNDAAAFTHLYGKKVGDPALDALVARHLAGDTAATQTLMNKALAEGRMTQRMTLFWEAVERAPDPQLYDLLAKHQKWFQEPESLALMEPSAKKVFLTALGTVKAAALPTIAPAVRTSLSVCYARFESRYEGTFGGLLRAYDGYRSKRSCEITLDAAPQSNAGTAGRS